MRLVPLILVVGLVALAAAVPAGGAGRSGERVVVPHFDPDTSPVYRHKPRRLTILLHPDADGVIQLRRLRWRDWGRRRTTATGRMRTGDPDNGYITGRVRVTLRGRGMNGCGDVSRRQYSRAVLRGPAVFGGRQSIAPLLYC